MACGESRAEVPLLHVHDERHFLYRFICTCIQGSSAVILERVWDMIWYYMILYVQLRP